MIEYGFVNAVSMLMKGIGARIVPDTERFVRTKKGTLSRQRNEKRNRYE